MNNNYYTYRTIGRMISILLPAILLVAMMFALSSCRDDLFYDESFYGEDDGELINVPLSLSVEPMASVNPETRAVEGYIDATPDEKRIHDFWIIEYHENGLRAGLPRYFTQKTDEEGNVTEDLPDNINVLIPREGRDNDTYTVVLIANSNDPQLFNKENSARYSTLDDLRRFDLTTHNQQHVFEPSPEHNKFLLMSGWTTIKRDVSTHNLKLNLLRNVCKVNVRLEKFEDRKLVYKYFQWRDVPLGKAFPHGPIDYTQLVSRDWKQHEDDDPEEKQKRADLEDDDGIDFWIPCNVWLPVGPEPNRVSEPKVTEDPTHFTIVCRAIKGWRPPVTKEDEAIVAKHPEVYNGQVPIESPEQYEFCLYPSKDKEKKKQFDFKPNHYYRMAMSIEGLSDPATDPFVNIIGYEYLEESNCYMLRRDSKVLYAVPLARINRFWEEYDDTKMLTDDTEWVAEVIWQDTPERIIDFVSFNEFQVNPNKDYLEGKGWGYFSDDELDDYGEPKHIPTSCFAFRTTGAGEGNVVIGLRKKVPGWEKIPVEKREYLWSWHIWVTEYDPNPEKEYNYHLNGDWGKNEMKRVLNGEVQRLFSKLENYKITQSFIESLHLPEGYPTYDDWEAPEDWEEGVYIMDRNLGATESGAYKGEAPFANSGIPSAHEIESRLPSFGMYYQYGRKDPFPFAVLKYQTVYDIYGNPIKAFNDKTPIHVPDQNVSGDEGNQNKSRRRTRAYGDTEQLPENGRKDTPVTMRVSKGGSFKKGVMHPYIFYTCDNVEDRWFSDEWVATENPEDIVPWCNPGWYSHGNKSLFDPCPPGWRLMDFMHFKVLSGGGTNEYSSGNLYLKTGLKDLNDNILVQPIFDWTVTGKFGRNIGFAIISNSDPNLYAWLPVTGKRYNDTGGMSIAEGFQDHAGHSGLWLDFENALKYFTNECQFKPNNESLAAGYPVRCIRDTEY